ncbi:glycoside hydrolase family 105 protein [Paradesertivirga mongoliensis]|uniref:Glycoside hydrolase family 105 protein n=1 Tax=Paradesertivirga mongoliensis TaxID=2100740 RepID=A0ABW4ZQ47_9SPHI|nr:glycoside hydrolase family 88 protein [Pedobacter mongoliensis]
MSPFTYTHYSILKEKNLSAITCRLKSLLSFLLPIFLSASLFAQETTPGRVPSYPVPYEFPTTDSIKGVLQRVRSYYEATSPQTIVNSKTGERIKDFTSFNPLAIPSKGFASEWSYTHGVVLSAFDYISKVTGDESYAALNTRFYNYVVDNLPYFEKATTIKPGEKIGSWGRILHFEALDDCGSIGAAMIKTYQRNKNGKYLPVINRVDEHVSKNQFRLTDGTLARNRPQYQSVWADDMYMSVPFLTNMGVLTGKKKYFDDAAKQVLQMGDRLYVPGKELFDHGWNLTSAAYDPRFYWGRANGWCLMAMAELLSAMPKDHQSRDKILHLYRSMVRSLASLQDGTGHWHNLLDKPDTYLETSCTAMFTYAIAKGINEGWISHVYGPVALTGWNAITTKVLPNGAVDGTVEGTTFAHDNTYYYYRGKSTQATHGYGPVLYAGAEMIRLLQNEKLEILKAKPNAVNSTYHFLLKSEWPKK